MVVTNALPDGALACPWCRWLWPPLARLELLVLAEQHKETRSFVARIGRERIKIVENNGGCSFQYRPVDLELLLLMLSPVGNAKSFSQQRGKLSLSRRP